MLLRRFYDSDLAQASYLVGCSVTGEALVVDPLRDIDPYLSAADDEGLRITHVAETHIHADFVSGTRELAARTGATPYLSGGGGVDWSYRFAAADRATILRDGDGFRVGNIAVEAIHTPGHTPEHLAYQVTDTAATDRPMGVFTGDFIFVGDVGRPDLLERAASIRGTMEAGARDLYRSLQRFKGRPDYLQLWPAHGAGSACGKALGAVPSTTLGYERLANWAFGIENEDEFVTAVLAGQPDPPKYFAVMKTVNRDGPQILRRLPRPEGVALDRLPGLIGEGAQVVDVRPAEAFAAGHFPGTINIPLNKSFTTWAGWLLRYDLPLYLVGPAAPSDAIPVAARCLALIGFDNLAGAFPLTSMDLSAAAGLQRIPSLSAAEAGRRVRSGEVDIVDVRARSEWDAGHISGVQNIPLGYLEDRIEDLPKDRPLVVQCQSGGRSAIAASLLRARGLREVYNLTGGFAAWEEAGEPVERADPVAAG